MVLAYWKIGERIVQYEQACDQKIGYGSKFLKELSKKLTADFGKGFTETNLKYFRQFYLTFLPMEISHAVSDPSFNPERQKVTHWVTNYHGRIIAYYLR
jgi:hypothetical protein